MIALKKITPVDLCAESINKLKDWRIKNRFAYKGTYKITQASMRKWLREYVLDKEDRVLYWVYAEGTCMGHIGLTNIKKDDAEICDVSRGLVGFPGAMHTALELLSAPYKRVHLRVLSSNTHAIEFYEKNGFTLIKTDKEDYHHYERYQDGKYKSSYNVRTN